MVFSTNKIFLDEDTLAEQLRVARQERGIKLNQAAKVTGIAVKYLDALEKGQFDKLPKGVYGKNFLREYALFLNLDYKELVKIYSEELETKKERDRRPLFSNQTARGYYFLSIPRLVKIFVITAAAAACLIYLSLALKNIFSPPLLSLDSPPENYFSEQKIVEVIGRTDPEAKITINGEQVLSDVDGVFKKTIGLKDGLNNIVIKAVKKHGPTSVVERQVLVKTP